MYITLRCAEHNVCVYLQAPGAGQPPAGGATGGPPAGVAGRAAEGPPANGAPQAGNGGAGRASHRGGAREEPRPGASAAQPPETQFAAMSLGTGDATARPRGERRLYSFQEPQTRPKHVIDKKGKIPTKNIDSIASFQYG